MPRKRSMMTRPSASASALAECSQRLQQLVARYVASDPGMMGKLGVCLA